MNVDDAKELYRLGAQDALELLRVHEPAAFKDVTRWWPKDRAGITARRQATVLSHAVALRWVANIPSGDHARFLCMNTGRSKDGLGSTAKAGLLELEGEPGIRWRSPRTTIPRSAPGRTGLCHLPGEAMLDMVVFPDPAIVMIGGAKHIALLTMESEMCPDHGVKEVISRFENDYAWDFFKLIWVPSPRRLFAARVGGVGRKAEQAERSRIAALCKFLDAIITSYGSIAFGKEDVLVILILAERDHKESVVRVVIGGDTGIEPAWAKLFPP